MSRSADEKSVSHSSAIRQIVNSAENTWQALLQLQAADDINPDGVFVEPNNSRVHPQKQAHSHLLGYHQLIANKEYTVRAQDMWEEELKDESGYTYQIKVPEKNRVHIDSDTLTLDDIDTDTEALSLETIHLNWGLRYIEVVSEKSWSYGNRETDVSRKRVWLPPKGIQLAFEQLEDVRAKIGLGAELGTPDWRAEKVLDPMEGVREPYGDE